MTKYRIRLANGRVIGPFEKNQLFELKSKGHIQGNEEAQIYPTGDWQGIYTFDFYKDLMDKDRTTINSESKEETFIIDLTKLRNQKNEKELERIDLLKHKPVKQLTETIRLDGPAKTSPKIPKLELTLDNAQELGIDPDFSLADDPAPEPQADRTLLNPVAQEDIEKIRKKNKEEAERILAEEQQRLAIVAVQKEKEEEEKKIAADESTQMVRLEGIKNELMVTAKEEEKKIELALKEEKKKRKKEEKEIEDEEDEEEDEEKKKKLKIIVIFAALAILYAILFPDDSKPKEKPFKNIPPQVDFPVPFDKADPLKSKAEYEKAIEFFTQGTYPDLIQAGIHLKNSYENSIDNEQAFNLLVRVYAEQLKYSSDTLADAQVIFNLIQGKRGYLSKNPNGIIAMVHFYNTIEKHEAAADVVAKYLKLFPKNVTQDLFAVYLQTLLKIGKIDLSKQFLVALEKAPQKNRYSYQALIDYYVLNQEMDKALDQVESAITYNPKITSFLLQKADFLLRDKKFKEVEPLLAKAAKMNVEYNNLNRAKFLELRGLILAYLGKVKQGTQLLTESLKINDSEELRMKLANLASSENMETATDKLIAESKAIKQLLIAKDFYEKKNYELALSSAARATDAFPGHIPSELFLSKVQLKLGLAEQGLKTLEDLSHKYVDDKNINLALVDAYIETYKFNDARNKIATLSSNADLKQSAEFASANGRLYIRMGDSLQALSWLRNSININPLNDEDIYLLAEILIKRANFDAARVLLNKCMELDPINPDYRISYSKIVYEQQDDQAAIGYLLGLLNEFGESPKILSEIAVFYYRSGKIKDFQAYKEKIEKLPVKDKALYEFLIKAALLDERFKEVPELVEKLLAIEPGDLESMMTAGKVLFETGKLIDAAKWFKRIQDKLPSYPKVLYYIAKIKYLSRDLDGSMIEINKDIKSNGESDSSLNLLAQIHVEKGELVDAENIFKKAQKINPRSYESLMGLAEISSKRNNFDQALDLYKKAMKEKGDEPVIHKKIGDVYRLLGQGSLAVESYKLYLEMNPEAADKGQIEAYLNLMN